MSKFTDYKTKPYNLHVNVRPLGESNTVNPKNQPYILDLNTLGRIYFQGLPQQIEVGGESNWVTLASMNRNNPFYHFTNSEDILKFTISWYANEESQEDVLKKCKWLRSLSKTDGNGKRPHHVQFSFGGLFKAGEFIVVEAPYTISLFNRELGMLPRLATQELTLKRVTEKNLTYSDLAKLDL